MCACVRACVSHRPWWSRSALGPSCASLTCTRRCSAGATLPCWPWTPSTEGKASVRTPAVRDKQLSDVYVGVVLWNLCHVAKNIPMAAHSRQKKHLDLQRAVFPCVSFLGVFCSSTRRKYDRKQPVLTFTRWCFQSY